MLYPQVTAEATEYLCPMPYDQPHSYTMILTVRTSVIVETDPFVEKS
jgi:hypothetical protein